MQNIWIEYNIENIFKVKRFGKKEIATKINKYSFMIIATENKKIEFMFLVIVNATYNFLPSFLGIYFIN